MRCCRLILEKSEAEPEEHVEPNDESERDTSRNRGRSTGNGCGHGEKGAVNEGMPRESENFSDMKDDELGRRRREAFFACTRRNHETLSLFLQEVVNQGLQYSLAYQATLDADTALFVYNEIHLPIKVYRITLPQDHCGTSKCAVAADKPAL